MSQRQDNLKGHMTYL